MRMFHYMECEDQLDSEKCICDKIEAEQEQKEIDAMIDEEREKQK